MNIVVTPVANKMFNAKLIIDEEIIKEVVENRPGCAVRTLVNWMYASYGAPEENFKFEVSGW